MLINMDCAAFIVSHSGLQADADVLLDPDTDLDFDDFEGYSCILVDEAQFLSARSIEQLRDLTIKKGVPVICYGLRTDFRTNLFEGSRRLLELADSIEEVKTTCAFCNGKAVFNLKSVDGKATVTGPAVCLGCEELYLPVCYTHFVAKIEEANGDGAEMNFQAIQVLSDVSEKEEHSAVPQKVSKNVDSPIDVKDLHRIIARSKEVEEPQ